MNCSVDSALRAPGTGAAAREPGASGGQRNPAAAPEGGPKETCAAAGGWKLVLRAPGLGASSMSAAAAVAIVQPSTSALVRPMLHFMPPLVASPSALLHDGRKER